MIDQVCEDLKKSDLLPKQMLADTFYGSDDNMQKCAQHNFDLISPVSGKPPKTGEKTISDFKVDEKTKTVQTCPADHTPVKSTYNKKTGKTRTDMSAEHCLSCKFREDCPVEKVKHGYRLYHTSKQLRLDKRRKNEKTDEFRKVYSKRSDVESTNSGIKRRTGMSRLRVRGKGVIKGLSYIFGLKRPLWMQFISRNKINADLLMLRSVRLAV